MDRRIIPSSALLLVAILWATWPAANWERLATTLPAGAAVLVALDQRRAAIVAVAAAAVVGAPMLVASIVEWRVWLCALAFVAAYDSILAPPRREPRQAWIATGLVLAWIALVGLAASVWRPTHAALLAPDSLLPGILMVAAVGTVVAVILVGRSAPPSIKADEPNTAE